MDVVFVTTTAENLQNVDIVNGQVIAIRNAPGYYYDHDGTRYRVGGINIVDSLPEPETVTPGDDSLYFLKIEYEEYKPGVYQINDDHTEWDCITAGSIGDDVPEDGHEYVRKDGQWVEPFATLYCTNSDTDVQRLNNVIQAFYASSKITGIIRIRGNWKLGQTIQISVSNPNKHLTLDFEQAVLSSYTSSVNPGIQINYNVTGTPADSGSVTICNLDGRLFQGQWIVASTSQLIKIHNCAFVHVKRTVDDATLKFIGDESIVKISDCQVYFPDTAQTVPSSSAILFTPVSFTRHVYNSITGCTFVSTVDDSDDFFAVQLPSMIDDMHIGQFIFDSNVLSSNVHVRDTAAGYIDVSMNNIITSGS